MDNNSNLNINNPANTEYESYNQNLNPLYLQSLKKSQKHLIKKDCNKIGFMLFISEILLSVVSVFLVFILRMYDKIDLSNPNTISGIPYSIYYFMNDICEFLGFFIVPLIFCLIYKFKIRDALPFNNNKRYSIPLLVLGGYAICTISNHAVSLLNYNLSLFQYKNEIGIELGAKTLTEQIIYFVSISIVPALAEEFMFRGVILNFLRKYGDGFAVLVSSILFGLFHGNFVQIPFAFIVGLVCGFLVVRTNSMLPSILLHFLNNGTSVIMDLVSSNSTQQFSDIISTIIIFALTLMGFISIVILAKKGLSFKFDNKPNIINQLAIKEKVLSFICNPGIIAVTILFISSALSV